MSNNLEPIGEKRSTSDREIQLYTSYELDLLAKDIDQLRQYHLYRPERSHIKTGKKDDLAFESQSPYFLDLLHARDWSGLTNEIATNGVSTHELSILTTAVIEHIYSGDFDSTDQLFSQLKLQQVARGCRITSPAKDYANRGLIIQSVSENIAFLVFDVELTAEQRRSKLGEYLAERDAFISSQSQSILEEFQRDGNLRKRLTGKPLQTTRQKLYSQFQQSLHRIIAKEIRKASSSFNHSSVLFPKLETRTFSHLSEKNIDEQYGETIEGVKNNLLAQYHSSSPEAIHAIRVLSHIDPELALVETTTDLSARREVVKEMLSSDPSHCKYLTDFGHISQAEIDQLGGYAKIDPNYYLVHYAELDDLESDQDEALAEAIIHASIDQILTVSQSDERIANLILHQPELHKHVSKLLTAVIIDAPVPLTAAAIISSCRLGNLEGLQEVYLSLMEKEVLVLRGELLSTFDLHNQEVIDDILGIGDKHRQYLQIIKQRLSQFAGEIQYAISLAAICCPGQSNEIQDMISESVYGGVLGYESRYKLSKPLQQAAATNILFSWGSTNESMYVLIETGISSGLNQEQRERMYQFITSVIDNHLGQEPDYANEDYWSENRLIALYIDTYFDSLDFVMREKLSLLLERDSELLDLVLTYESVQPEGYAGLISDQLAERIIFAKSDVKEKMRYLILFATGRSGEFVAKLFQEIQRRHPVLTTVSSLYQYQRLLNLFSEMPINPESISVATTVESQLSHSDRRYLAEFDFSRSGAFEKQVAYLSVSKFLQSKGISEAHSIGWAARACRKYQDRNYDSLLDENVRQTYSKIDAFLQGHTLELAQFILDQPSINWEVGAPRLIDMIIGNQPEEIKNFLEIFSGKLGLSPNQELILHRLFTLKDLRQGRIARRSIICGLLELSSTQRGAKTIGSLLESADLSKDDPKRLRTILRLKGLVDVPEIVSRNQGRLLQIRDVVMSEVSDAICAEIGILSVDKASLGVNVEYFISSGFMAAYVALSKRYSQLENPRSLNVLKQAVGQLLDGNFKDWRESHEVSVQQLSIVGKEVADTWRIAQDKVQIEAAPESINNLIKTVRSSMFDLVIHLPFVTHNIENELSNCLVKIETMPNNPLLKEQLERISRKKEVVDLINKIRKYDLFIYPKENLIELVRLLFHQLESLSANQSSQDAGELLRLLSLSETFQAGETLTVSDTDDPIHLVNSGVYPRETCQSWRQGIYNECLVSTLCDANTRMLAVEDSEGQVVGRALMKLLPLQADEGDEFPAVVLETIYSLRDNSAIEKVILRAALKKAQACGLPLVIKDYFLAELIQGDPEFSCFRSESAKLLLGAVNLTGEFGYSDLFGGRLIDEQGLREPCLLQIVMSRETEVVTNNQIEVRGEPTPEELIECTELEELLRQYGDIHVQAKGMTANMVVYGGEPGPCVWFTVSDSPVEYQLSVAKNTFRGRSGIIPGVVVSDYPFHNHPELGPQHYGATLHLLVLTKVERSSGVWAVRQ